MRSFNHLGVSKKYKIKASCRSALNAEECAVDVYCLNHVQFRYEDDAVLDDVNFVVQPADFVGIVGENGGGKTTLLRLLTGEKKPVAGTLTFFGEKGISQKAMHRIGYVPQINPANGMTFPISTREMVALGLTRHITPRFFLNHDEREKVEFSMRHLGIEDLASKNFHDLSCGQKQRVMIAKALVDQPDVLIFDEPTVGIDPESKEQFYATLDHMNRVHHITILMVTHEVDQGRNHWTRMLRVKNHRVEEL